jgi:hypothetical protein
MQSIMKGFVNMAQQKEGRSVPAFSEDVPYSDIQYFQSA